MERLTFLIIHADGTSSALIPAVERNLWQEKMPHVQTQFWRDEDGFESSLKALCNNLQGRIGVEGLRMRVREQYTLKHFLSNNPIIDAHEIIAEARLLKNQSEIPIIKKAIDISEKALSKTIQNIQVGMSEVTLRSQLNIALLEEGAEGFAFDSIVLFGSNSANCHGHASDANKLKTGDTILFDFGATYGGYNGSAVVANTGKKSLAGAKLFKESGDPCRIRTCDLRLRRPVLYPAELRDLFFILINLGFSSKYLHKGEYSPYGFAV